MTDNLISTYMSRMKMTREEVILWYKDRMAYQDKTIQRHLAFIYDAEDYRYLIRDVTLKAVNDGLYSSMSSAYNALANGVSSSKGLRRTSSLDRLNKLMDIYYELKEKECSKQSMVA